MTQMSTPGRDAQNDGNSSRTPVGDAASGRIGHEASSPLRHEGAAGQASANAQPLLPSVGIGAALELLKSTLAQMHAANLSTTAAGVSARMRLADPMFTPQTHGFRNFRALLDEAVARGAVSLSKPEGASDVTVRLADTVLPRSAPKEWMRRDLWRAMRGRDATPHGFSRESGVTRHLDSPEDLATDEVLVPQLDVSELSGWMAEFAEAVEDDPTRQLLREALSSDHPVEAFYTEVAKHPRWFRRWSGTYRSRLTQRVDGWADENDIDRATLREPAGREHDRGSVAAATSLQLTEATSSASSEREAILRAVEKMTLAELMRLPIPAEYLLRR